MTSTGADTLTFLIQHLQNPTLTLHEADIPPLLTELTKLEKDENLSSKLFVYTLHLCLSPKVRTLQKAQTAVQRIASEGLVPLVAQLNASSIVKYCIVTLCKASGFDMMSDSNNNLMSVETPEFYDHVNFEVLNGDTIDDVIDCQLQLILSVFELLVPVLIVRFEEIDNLESSSASSNRNNTAGALAATQTFTSNIIIASLLKTNIVLRPIQASALATCLIDLNSAFSACLSEELFQKLITVLVIALNQKDLALDEIPPLVYQIALVVTRIQSCCTDKHRIQALSGITNVFDRLRVQSLSSSSNSTNISSNRELIKWTEYTALSHLTTAFRQDNQLVKAVLKYVQQSSVSQTSTLTPFQLTLVLSVSASLPRMKSPSINLIRKVIQEEVELSLRGDESVWLNCLLVNLKKLNDSECVYSEEKEKNRLLSTLVSVMSSCHESLLPSFVDLAFELVGIVKKDSILEDPKENKVHLELFLIGCKLLQHLFTNESVTTLRQNILSTINSKMLSNPKNPLVYGYALLSLANEQSTMVYLCEHVNSIVDLLSHLPSGGVSPKLVERCLIPVLRELLMVRRNYVDQCFLFTKKALFSNAEVQGVAVKCLVLLLEVILNDPGRYSISVQPRFNRKNAGNSLEEELKSYLIRSMTTQPSTVRSDTYKELTEIVKRAEAEENAGVKDGVQKIILSILQIQLERYVELRENDKQKLARQRRSKSLGTQLSQSLSQHNVDALDEDTSDSNIDEEMPIDFMKCISDSSSKVRVTTTWNFQHNKRKRSKESNISKKSLIDKSLELMSEPICDLLQACISVSHECPESELFSEIVELRKVFSRIDLGQFLSCDKKHGKAPSTTSLAGTTKNGSEEVLLAKVLLVCSVSEVFMLAGCNNDGDGGDENIVLNSLFSLRQECVGKASKIVATFDSVAKDGSRKKKQKVNEEDKENSRLILNDSSIKKSRDTIASTVQSLTPFADSNALSYLFGVVGNGSNDKEASKPSERVVRDFELMHLLIGKALEWLCRNQNVFSVDSAAHEKRSQKCISDSLKLGPHFFHAFIAYCKELPSLQEALSNSIAMNMGELSLQAFIACVRGIAVDMKGSGLTKSQRVSALLSASLSNAAESYPDLKSFWCLDKLSEMGSGLEKLKTTLFKVFLPPLENDDEEIAKASLLEELVIGGLDTNASKCIELISAMATVMNNADMKAKIALCLLKVFERVENDDLSSGVFKLINDDDRPCTKTYKVATHFALLLGGSINSGSYLPIVPQNADNQSIMPGELRAKFNVPTLSENDWKHVTEVCSYPHGSLPGISQVLSASICKKFGPSPHFTKQLDHSSLKKWDFVLVCTDKLLEKTSKDAEEAIEFILRDLDNCLTYVEFVLSKLVSPECSTQHLEVIQEFLAARISACLDVWNIISPSAGKIESNGAVSILILRLAKRIYITFVKYLNSFTQNIAFLVTSRLSKRLIKIISEDFADRVKCSLQAGLNDLKNKGLMDTYGKVAALVVFEREKSDTTIVKIANKLKKMELEDESDWLSNRTQKTIDDRDFRLNEDRMEEARTAEETKISSKKKKEARKKKSQDPSEEEQENDDDDDETRVEEDDKSTNAKKKGKQIVNMLEGDENGDHSDQDTATEMSVGDLSFVTRGSDGEGSGLEDTEDEGE